MYTPLETISESYSMQAKWLAPAQADAITIGVRTKSIEFGQK